MKSIVAEPAEQLHRVFCALADVPDVEWRYFRSFLRERRFHAGEHLAREGELATTIDYIVTGLVRNYHIGDGTELVRGFDFESRFAAVFECVLTGDPSTLNIQALEPTHTVAFPGEVLRELYDRHSCWDRIGRRLLEQQWVRRQDKEMRFRIHSAGEHYRLLIDRHSPLVTRVPLRQLASYLGVTPETLSRIRARLRAPAASSGVQPSD